jgi:excisionase family DNA binding protein
MESSMATTKLTYSVAEFASTVGISRSQVYLEIKNGHLTVAKIGKRTLVPVSEAQQWLDRAMQHKGAGV